MPDGWCIIAANVSPSLGCQAEEGVPVLRWHQMQQTVPKALVHLHSTNLAKPAANVIILCMHSCISLLSYVFASTGINQSCNQSIYQSIDQRINE